jgi:hypothetical protein
VDRGDGLQLVEEGAAADFGRTGAANAVTDPGDGHRAQADGGFTDSL